LIMRLIVAWLTVACIAVLVAMAVWICGEPDVVYDSAWEETGRLERQIRVAEMREELGADLEKAAPGIIEELEADPDLMATAIAMLPEATSCLDSVGNLTIILELVQRGLVRWGCFDYGRHQLRWSAPQVGSPAVTYDVRVTYWMTVPAMGLAPGDSQWCFIPIPEYADSATAQVAGTDTLLRTGPFAFADTVVVD